MSELIPKRRPKQVFSTRIRADLKDEVNAFCQENDLDVVAFVEDAFDRQLKRLRRAQRAKQKTNE